ncbi:hypothetical protein SBF1_450022 [Candidatus Desulfosporosinus infrequens]|uniref:Uncharacterized protein n=1 Tax=Candidatus Desulfosporosinus infrequens TaxID=2043169 RepID=A0A2U3LBQ5_9FIRM|nr:hypothetical protein SBF1_450022 [Candidatus Desulfosporosinus infrequens]
MLLRLHWEEWEKLLILEVLLLVYAQMKWDGLLVNVLKHPVRYYNKSLKCYPYPL